MQLILLYAIAVLIAFSPKGSKLEMTGFALAILAGLNVIINSIFFK